MSAFRVSWKFPKNHLKFLLGRILRASFTKEFVASGSPKGLYGRLGMVHGLGKGHVVHSYLASSRIVCFGVWGVRGCGLGPYTLNRTP